MRAQCSFLLAALAGVFASDRLLAQELYIGSTSTIIQRGNPQTGNFQVIGACGGQVHSMTADREDLFIGDVTGRIYRYDDSTGVIGYAFDALNDATALNVDGDELLVGGSDGTVFRHDRLSGAVIDQLQAPFPVSAMVRLDRTLYVGTSAGLVFRTTLPADSFEFFGTCSAPIRSMIQHDLDLVLGTSGAIYRVGLESGTITGSYTISNDATGLVVYQGTLLVSGTNKSILRVNPWTGASTGSTLTSQFDVSAMALNGLPAPGTPYCFGTACPCGNDDPGAGCANSTGHGALLEGVGSPSVAQDDLVLLASGMPANQFALFYMGAGVIDVPFGDGKLCAGAGGYGNFRFLPVRKVGASGSLALGPGIVWHADQHFGATGQVVPGFTWNFQIWYRDGNGSPCGGHFNLSNAYATTFQP
jgi:hypothetical protein